MNLQQRFDGAERQSNLGAAEMLNKVLPQYVQCTYIYVFIHTYITSDSSIMSAIGTRKPIVLSVVVPFLYGVRF